MCRLTLCALVRCCAGEGERSLLVLDNVVRIRTACAHNEPELLAALSSIARRDKSGPQQVELVNDFKFRGQVFQGRCMCRREDMRWCVGRPRLLAAVAAPDSVCTLCAAVHQHTCLFHICALGCVLQRASEP